MQNAFRFETPENVQVEYEPAGPGTRFVGWLIDQILIILGLLALTVVLIAVGASLNFTLSGFESNRPEDVQRMMFYIGGAILLAWSLGSFVYFSVAEYFLRGQTVGKRLMRIRVIKSSGFQLDAASILIRNVFRVLDHLPPMWIFPVASKHGQRAGDMVAGTLVIHDSQATLSPVRAELGNRSVADAQFRFDASQLKRLSSDDFYIVEQLLTRWNELSPQQRVELLPALSQRIAAKLKLEHPPFNAQQQFLEDLLAAELRRQERTLV